MENISLSNSSLNETNCSFGENLQQLAAVSWKIGYQVITPFHFIFGLPAHVIVLLAFYKQNKSDKGYTLQFLVSISKFCLLIFYVLYVITFNWFSGVGSDGATWFMRSYVLMWYAAHLSIPISNVFFILSVFLSVTLAGDRLFSIAAPVAYNKPNHINHQLIIVVICVVITLLINVWECFEADIGETDNHYVIILTVSTLSNIMGHIRVTFLILSTILFTVFNSLLIYFYHKQNKRVSQLINNQENETRRAREKTLFVITTYESIMISLSCYVTAAFYLAVDTSSWFSDCGFIPYQPLQDMSVELADSLEFYMIFACSSRFRGLVVDAVPFLGRFIHENKTQVQMISSAS